MEASKWPAQLAAHHFVAEKHAVSRKDIGQAVIRHFGEPARFDVSLDLTAIDAADLHRNVGQRRHLGEARLA